MCSGKWVCAKLNQTQDKNRNSQLFCHHFSITTMTNGCSGRGDIFAPAKSGEENFAEISQRCASLPLSCLLRLHFLSVVSEFSSSIPSIHPPTSSFLVVVYQYAHACSARSPNLEQKRKMIQPSQAASVVYNVLQIRKRGELESDGLFATPRIHSSTDRSASTYLRQFAVRLDHH